MILDSVKLTISITYHSVCLLVVCGAIGGGAIGVGGVLRELWGRSHGGGGIRG